MVKKLNFSTDLLLSPVKGASSIKFGTLRPDTTIVKATICPNSVCRSAQPILVSSAPKRQCTECRTWLLPDSMEFSLDPRARLDDSLRSTLLCSTPTCLQLALAGYGLTDQQQQLQQSRQQLGLFPTSPLVSTEELRAGQSAGVLASQAYHDWKSLRSHLAFISEVTQRIGTGTSTSYSTLVYLSARGTTPMSTRYQQQSELLRAFKDAKVDQIIKAVLEGWLLMSEDASKNGSLH